MRASAARPIVLVLLTLIARFAIATDVQLAHTNTVQSRSSVVSSCGGISSTGCTVFTNVTIYHICSFDEGEWRVRWLLKGTALSFVSNIAAMKHESLHVTDVRARLNGVVAKVESGRFASEAACEKASDEAIARFPDQLRDLFRSDVLQVDRRTMTPSQIVAARH